MMGGGGRAGPAVARGGGGAGRHGLDDVADVDGVVFDKTHRAAARWPTSRPYRWPSCSGRCSLTIASPPLMTVLGPYLIKIAIDEHIANGDIPGLTVILG